MTNEEYAKQCEFYSDCERKSGGSIEIERNGLYIAIKMSNGDEYYFQGQEADYLLADVPDFVNQEDYLLSIAQNW